MAARPSRARRKMSLAAHCLAAIFVTCVLLQSVGRHFLPVMPLWLHFRHLSSQIQSFPPLRHSYSMILCIRENISLFPAARSRFFCIFLYFVVFAGSPGEVMGQFYGILHSHFCRRTRHHPSLGSLPRCITEKCILSEETV